MKANSNGVLHFVCGFCRTHLTVNEAVAGTEGPCPKCGKLVTAPELFRGHSTVTGENSPNPLPLEPTFPTSSSVQQVRGASFRVRRSPTGTGPTRTALSTENAEAEKKTVLKIVLAIGLVALVVLLVVWYLRNF